MADEVVALTVWLTVLQAASMAQVGKKTIYREIRAGRLRAAIIGGRRSFRIHEKWVSDWLIASAAPIELRR